MYRLTEYAPDGRMITSTDMSDLGIAYAVQRDLAAQGRIALVTFAR